MFRLIKVHQIFQVLIYKFIISFAIKLTFRKLISFFILICRFIFNTFFPPKARRAQAYS